MKVIICLSIIAQTATFVVLQTATVSQWILCFNLHICKLAWDSGWQFMSRQSLFTCRASVQKNHQQQQFHRNKRGSLGSGKHCALFSRRSSVKGDTNSRKEVRGRRSVSFHFHFCAFFFFLFSLNGINWVGFPEITWLMCTATRRRRSPVPMFENL